MLEVKRSNKYINPYPKKKEPINVIRYKANDLNCKVTINIKIKTIAIIIPNIPNIFEKEDIVSIIVETVSLK